MRRSVLVTWVIIGSALSLVSGTGLFAALTDTARTGTNLVDTQALQGSSDLRIATATVTGGVFECGTFTDDLSSPLITLSDQVPGYDTGTAYQFCLRNLGSQRVNLSALSEGLSDVELACTGDEAVYDTTCVSGQAGELRGLVRVSFFGQVCASGASQEPPNSSPMLADTTTTPVSFGTLDPGATRCFATALFMSGQSTAAVQAAQTDRLTWRYAFTGEV